jgi:aspartyl-tRNA(Asn)/glutamyl-tRNA(Gln) amidotransferase subunit A
VIEVSTPDVQRLLALGTLINQSEASAIHSRWMQIRPQDYSVVFRGRIEAGYFIPATRYLEAVMLRARLLDEFVGQVFTKVDLLHTPVTPTPAPTIAATNAKTAGDVLRLLGAITRNMRPLSYLGIPAASVPAGFSASGLPISMQLAGRPFAEALILRAAHAYQSVTDWHTRVPPL